MYNRKRSCEVPLQDFARIQLLFLPNVLSNGKLFTDVSFPPDKSSLTYVYSGDDRYDKMVFKRPKEICVYCVFAGVGGVYETPFPWQRWKKGAWFEAAVAVVSLNVKLMDQLIPGYRNFEQSFQSDYIGCFCFKLWRFGDWIDIVVDDHLPTLNNRLLYCQAYGTPMEFWGPLLEKSYAKCKKTYEAIECGKTLDALTDITGGVCEFFTPDINPPENLFHILYKSCVNRSQIVCWRNDKILTPTGFKTRECTDELPDEDNMIDKTIQRFLHIVTAATKFPVLDGRMVEMVRLLCLYKEEPVWSGKFSNRDEISWGTVNTEFVSKYKPLANKEQGEYWMTLEDFRCNFGGLIICSNETPYTTEGLSLQRSYRYLTEEEMKTGQQSLFAEPKEKRRSSDCKHRIHNNNPSYFSYQRNSDPINQYRKIRHTRLDSNVSRSVSRSDSGDDKNEARDSGQDSRVTGRDSSKDVRNDTKEHKYGVRKPIKESKNATPENRRKKPDSHYLCELKESDFVKTDTKSNHRSTKHESRDSKNDPNLELGILVKENVRTVKIDNTVFTRDSRAQKLRLKRMSDATKYFKDEEPEVGVSRRRRSSPVHCFHRENLHCEEDTWELDTNRDNRTISDSCRDNSHTEMRIAGGSRMSSNDNSTSGSNIQHQQRSGSLTSMGSGLSECHSTFSTSDITFSMQYGLSRENSIRRPKSAPINIVRNASSGSLPNIIVNNFKASSSDNFRSHGAWRYVVECRGRWEKSDSVLRNIDLKHHVRNPRILLNILHPDAINQIVAPGYYGKSHVIVSLLQDYRHGAKTANSLLVPIGFSVYKTKNPGKDEKRPLSKLALTGEATSKDDSREITCRFDLLPGSYFIVPYCLSENHSGQYLVRVLAEKDPVAGKTGCMVS
ncbi:Calpain-1 catalytic subunit [Mactra antiquata]